MLSIFARYRFWLAATVVMAVLFSCSGFGLSLGEYVIQDDARQHVFWLQRLNDPELFSNDLIADYFSSVAPAGYKFVYWCANLLGLEPLAFNKFLPLLLGVGTSIYFFLVTIAIFPVPLGGFFCSLLLNQNLWLLDDLVSGTPRAFLYFLFLGFLYYLLHQQLLPCLLMILLQGLFYPQVVLLSAGILSLNIITKRKNRNIYIAGLLMAIATVAVYKLQTADFSQVITLAKARELPEFAFGGRSAFFLTNPWAFWLFAKQSGWFPFEWQYFFLCSFGLLLPAISKFSDRFPLVKQLNSKKVIIGQILLTSFGWYCLSHLLLFRLHLPSRYSQHTNRLVIALLAGVTLTILLHKLIEKVAIYAPVTQWSIVAIATVATLYPTYAVQSYPQRLGYVEGKSPELYQFLQQQPKDITIATLTSEADFIPSFARRTVLTAREYSIPYHWDYYSKIRQRTKALIQAQYSPDLKELKQFIRQYQADLWLVDSSAFSPQYLTQNDWLRQFKPEVESAIANLATQQPAIVKNLARCSIFQTEKLNLLTAKCLLDSRSDIKLDRHQITSIR